MSRLHIMPVLIAAAACLALSPLAAAQSNDFYADARVARLADVDGEVSMVPAGGEQWGEAYRNRPLIAGDRLVTGPRGRAAMQLGDAALRVDDDSAIEFLSLDARLTQVELSRGTLNLRVREMYGEQIYEIDTPTLAFVAEEPGSYRIDVAAGGDGAMVTVFDGQGTVYGVDGQSRRVYEGRSYRFDDSRLVRVDVDSIPRGDDFDRYCAVLDRGYANSVSSRYVADNVIGYRDLDRYGDWDNSIRYGSIWYPRHVSVGWRPYHDGHWAWVAPWGWTWVDNAAWGFAPFHYGRWAYVGSRWGWIPGPRHHRAVYAPALVAFIGGSHWSLSIGLGNVHPVGWFPLGPRDLYLPPYRVGRDYFRRVNITNVRVVNRTVINNFYDDYREHRVADRRSYMYLNNPRAVTVVSRDVFTGAGSVARSAHVVTEHALSKVSVARSPQIAPRVASLGVSPRGRPPELASTAFASKVVTRNTPRARSLAFSERQALIAKQDGQPLSAAQRSELRQHSTTVARNSVARGAPRGQPATLKRTTVEHAAAHRADTGSRARHSVVARQQSAPRVVRESSPRAAPQVSRGQASRGQASPEAAPTATPRSAPPRMVRAPRAQRTPRASTQQSRSRPTNARRRANVVAERAQPRARRARSVRAPVSRTPSRAHIASVDESMIPRAKPIQRARSAPRVVQTPVIQHRQPSGSNARTSRAPQVSRAMPRAAPSRTAPRQIESRRPTSTRAPRPMRQTSSVSTPRRVARQPAAAPTRSHSSSRAISSRSKASTSNNSSRRVQPRGTPRSRRGD